MFKLLIVEDEVQLQEGLKGFLEEAGYQVEVASDGMEGLMKFQQDHYDLVLLDIMMPKIDGYTVLEMIRLESDIPVIMLTAKDSLEDELKGFNLKADDYIKKPFLIEIVIKRIEIALRKRPNKETVKPSSILSFEGISLNLDNHEVLVNETEVILTHKEFNLLKILLENPTRVFSREHLLDQLWGIDYFGTEVVVNVHINNLRKKIGVDYIHAVRGVGYKLDKKN